MKANFFTFSCDLLEKSYLCGINNNSFCFFNVCDCVVICLKSLTFVVSITTRAWLCLTARCCDLLEKSYLCGINNNAAIKKKRGSSVKCVDTYHAMHIALM